jgi:hypothetical protein
MSVKLISDETKKFFQEVLNEKCRIIGVLKDEDKWKAVCEVLVDTDYTTRKGLGDIVEIYNVYLSNSGEIIGYEITSTKKRSSLEE